MCMCVLQSHAGATTKFQAELASEGVVPRVLPAVLHLLVLTRDASEQKVIQRAVEDFNASDLLYNEQWDLIERRVSKRETEHLRFLFAVTRNKNSQNIKRKNTL